jgi:hypothetical protein
VTIAEGLPTDGGVGPLYSWALQAHQGSGDFFTVVEGQFDPSGSVKQGSGRMLVTVADFRDRLSVDDTFKQLDQIFIAYDTASAPVTVGMAFQFKDGNDAGISGVGYQYKENADLSGTIFYEVRSTSAETSVVDATAGWLPSGVGRAVEKVVAGTYAGFSVSECWDTAFKVTLYSESWPTGVTHGSLAACPTIPGR